MSKVMNLIYLRGLYTKQVKGCQLDSMSISIKMDRFNTHDVNLNLVSFKEYPKNIKSNSKRTYKVNTKLNSLLYKYQRLVLPLVYRTYTNHRIYRLLSKNRLNTLLVNKKFHTMNYSFTVYKHKSLSYCNEGVNHVVALNDAFSNIIKKL